MNEQFPQQSSGSGIGAILGLCLALLVVGLVGLAAFSRGTATQETLQVQAHEGGMTERKRIESEEKLELARQRLEHDQRVANLIAELAVIAIVLIALGAFAVGAFFAFMAFFKLLNRPRRTKDAEVVELLEEVVRLRRQLAAQQGERAAMVIVGRDGHPVRQW